VRSVCQKRIKKTGFTNSWIADRGHNLSMTGCHLCQRPM